MQACINLAQALLERGRELWEQDRYEAANQILTRLLGLRVIPAEIAERAQFYLGDMQLAQGHYSKARRHLAAAIGGGSGSGETHFLMACALDWEDDSDRDQAYRHYRRAVELEPSQPLYSSAYALMRIRRKGEGPASKYDREALRRLRDSFAASPDDPDIVHNYAFGLMEMGRHTEADIAIRRGRKRWPDHPAFEGLWCDFLIARGVLPPTENKTQPVCPRLRVVAEEEPIILRFPAAEPPPVLRPRSKLKTVIASLTDREVAELASNLGLVPTDDVGQRRQLLQRALLNRETLRSVVGRLSVGSRHLIQVLANAGGSTEIRRLRLRVDGPSKSRPHFDRRPAAKPLDELRRAGLAYLTARSPDQPKPDLVMIPSDLGKLLREILVSQAG